jgi:hypothetical protein
MEELEQYECFGVPGHVWVETDGSLSPQAPGANRRNWVYREVAALGAEAMPSPPVDLVPN